MERRGRNRMARPARDRNLASHKDRRGSQSASPAGSLVVRLKFLGVPKPANSLNYTGFDPVLRRPIAVVKGDWVEVSREKARQLVEDFPGAWQEEKRIQGLVAKRGRSDETGGTDGTHDNESSESEEEKDHAV